MNTKVIFLLVMVLSGLNIASAHAQTTRLLLASDVAMTPAKPTSADTINLLITIGCAESHRYVANAYQTRMSRNRITVQLGAQSQGVICPATRPAQIPLVVDLGRLPPGDYTVTLERTPIGANPPSIALDNAPFTVADSYANGSKGQPYVRLDYSGHWWDPNDSGWGLFIWHGTRDEVFAAWFTYGVDGKPTWYVVQQASLPNLPNPWFTFASTYYDLPLYQTSRPPGTLIPPPNPTTVTNVGEARLDFSDYGSADEGKFIYTFKGGATQVRNIRRFR